ncbi:unnamed protein product [Arctia plantaginis]|uniref:Uncharacterized protein n=1 Tax=Arctia plantaginis TaxID=874455 RepID=A0A8S1B4A7_ARCPL|nr:unnamed protein product [Arctia plantaginis]
MQPPDAEDLSHLRRSESHHQLLYVPYSTHYHYQHNDAYNAQVATARRTSITARIPITSTNNKSVGAPSTPQPNVVAQQQRGALHSFATYTDDVSRARPLQTPYQLLNRRWKANDLLFRKGGSPTISARDRISISSGRGAPEGAPAGVSPMPSVTSPMGPPQNPVITL